MWCGVGDTTPVPRALPSPPQLARAQQEAAAVLAKATARAQVLMAAAPRSRGAAESAELVDSSLHRLSEADDAEQPAVLLKRCGRVGWRGGVWGRVPSQSRNDGGREPYRLQPAVHTCRCLGTHTWSLSSVPAHDGGCYGLAFNRTGDLLASGGADKCVKLWDPFTATLTATLRVGGCRLA